MNIQNPPGFVISTEAQKAAFDNGYRLERVIQDGWLNYSSTTVPGDISIAASSDQGPWLLKISHEGVAQELGASFFTSEKLSGMYEILGNVYRLSISLPDEPLIRFQKATADLPRTTEMERLVVQRVGQNLFRDALLEYWVGKCPLTGITERELLKASHIVPWAECESDHHRLDVHNGVLLSALWDAAFDRGLISFLDDGTVLTSPRLSLEARVALNIEADLKLIGLKPEHGKNLQLHRKRFGF